MSAFIFGLDLIGPGDIDQEDVAVVTFRCGERFVLALHAVHAVSGEHGGQVSDLFAEELCADGRMFASQLLDLLADKALILRDFFADFDGGGGEDVLPSVSLFFLTGKTGFPGEQGLVVPGGTPKDLNGVG